MNADDILEKHYEATGHDLNVMARTVAFDVVPDLAAEDLSRARAEFSSWVARIFSSAFDRAIAARVRAGQPTISAAEAVARKRSRRS